MRPKLLHLWPALMVLVHGPHMKQKDLMIVASIHLEVLREIDISLPPPGIPILLACSLTQALRFLKSSWVVIMHTNIWSYCLIICSKHD
jgi:hypothetical protein